MIDQPTAPSLVAVVAVAAPLPTPLHYLVPASLQAQARPGVRVQVPLGRRTVVGFLLSVTEGDGAGLREVAEVLDQSPLFPAELVPFFLRAADHYRYPPGEAIRTALPTGLSGEVGRLAPLQERVFTPGPAVTKTGGRRQQELLDYVQARGRVTLTTLRATFPASYEPLKRLLAAGLLEETAEEKWRDPFLSAPLPPDRPVIPNPEQAAAIAAIAAAAALGTFAPLLLHGVTGSGKTEVYLRAIAAVLAGGRQALVLVPEIALTPQLVGRFRARFGADGVVIAVLHSGLSDGERYDAWRRIARGEVQIVIGARSAVFAPLLRTGIIVVDEEHEASYKQGDGFRYHGRDLALLRGQMSQAVVLLGSATPTVSTFHRAQSGITGWLTLSQRIENRPLPQVQLVDMRQEQGSGILSAPLLAALQATLQRGEQALLLLNRRGFSPYLLCTDCGTSFRCPNCEITLTYHQGRRLLRCHYCDFAQTPPEVCPGCGGARIFPEGAGTERLEEELAGHLPTARIARMDRDTTTRKGAHQTLLTQMLQGELDVLVGTQMVAKGHDFPGVTLVGVINADSSLNFPDFRSAERTFALLTQVAGRAGRGERLGQVLIQTFAPEHYAVACAADHDFQRFFAQELEYRRELGYPPFGFLVNLVCAGNDGERVGQAAATLAAALQAAGREVEVLGPAPCPLAKLRGKTRSQILLKAPRRRPLQRLLESLPELRRQLPGGVQLTIDVDPLDML